MQKITKNVVKLLVLCIFLWSCTEEEEKAKVLEEPSRYSKENIDQIINKSLQERNEFKWEYTSSDVLRSALVAGDSLLAIGYKPENIKSANVQISTVDIHSSEWQAAKNQTLLKIVTLLNQNSANPVKASDVVFAEDNILPFIIIKTTNTELIKLLRKTPTVRYVEPTGYAYGKFREQPNNRMLSLGCGNDPDNSIPAADYQVLTPNVKMPWNYPSMKIAQAWQYSTGRNIGVGLIDTGLSPDQNKLGSNFNQGESSGRQIFKFGTYKSSGDVVDGPDDRCGHGTLMAGVIAAPRGTDGSSVGIAYNANLVGIRGTSDVIIENTLEQQGVVDALKILADRSDVKIISMSIGTPINSSIVADAVKYAYGKEKLIFCAAGTSTTFTAFLGVIFPARMDEAVAVTGIVEGSYTACATCHKGSKVDFAVVMQRAGSPDKTSLSLANYGDQPGRIGGSSVATATVAGIAALVWSTNPSMTRSQVLERLKTASALYPNRHSNFGWGIIDAHKAVTMGQP